MSHFNVSFIVWTKSQDSVHKPPFLKREESRSGSNRGPAAYQPSALPLGHTGSQRGGGGELLSGFPLYSLFCPRMSQGTYSVHLFANRQISTNLVTKIRKMFSFGEMVRALLLLPSTSTESTFWTLLKLEGL